MYRCCFSEYWSWMKAIMTNLDQLFEIQFLLNLYWPDWTNIWIFEYFLDLVEEQWLNATVSIPRTDSTREVSCCCSDLSFSTPLNDSLTTDILLPTTKLSFVTTMMLESVFLDSCHLQMVFVAYLNFSMRQVSVTCAYNVLVYVFAEWRADWTIERFGHLDAKFQSKIRLVRTTIFDFQCE